MRGVETLQIVGDFANTSDGIAVVDFANTRRTLGGGRMYVIPILLCNRSRPCGGE